MSLSVVVSHIGKMDRPSSFMSPTHFIITKAPSSLNLRASLFIHCAAPCSGRDGFDTYIPFHLMNQFTFLLDDSSKKSQQPSGLYCVLNLKKKNQIRWC